MSIIPPLPGDPLLSVADVAGRARCSRQAIHDAIRNGRLSACRVAGRVLITSREAERLIRDWPARKKGIAARWREFREWQAQQRAATRARADGGLQSDSAVSTDKCLGDAGRISHYSEQSRWAMAFRDYEGTELVPFIIPIIPKRSKLLA